MLEYIAYSQKGTFRTKNQDRVLANNKVIKSGCIKGKIKNSFLAVVCDGAGSQEGGALAAEIVAQSFRFLELNMISPLFVSHHLHSINRKILLVQKQIPFAANMASTVAGIVICKDKYLIFNLGDTRVYEYRNGIIYQRTKDHILANTSYCAPENYAAGKNAIFSYVGGCGIACAPSITRGNVSDGECYFIICSDGIYKTLPDDVITDILSEESTMEEKSRAILKRSLQNDSGDDMSLVLIRCAT